MLRKDDSGEIKPLLLSGGPPSLNNKPDDKDFLLNFDELMQRAESGNTSAQYLVGTSLQSGYPNV